MTDHMIPNKVHTIKTGANIMALDQPKVMGIVNLTDDSFYKGSRVMGADALVDRVGCMLEEGADIIDIGAMSTRPGAEEISEMAEEKRIEAASDLLTKAFPEMILSVDTYRGNVAKVALEKGAHIINDVSGLSFDEGMIQVLADFKPVYVLMHNRGKASVMKKLTAYDDLLGEIMQFLYEKIAKLRSLGLHDVIIDPGIGFSKTIQQNFRLMNNLTVLHRTGLPVLVGLSRKSFIYRTIGTTPERSLHGTGSLHMVALRQGANILRVHDVKEAREVVSLYNALKNS